MQTGSEFITPKSITGNDIRSLRQKLHMTQREFAALVGTSKPTVERWESGTGEIRGPIVLLSEILKNKPSIVETLRVPPREYPLRMWYMHRQSVCTLIDVDLLNRDIRIKNFTPNVVYRAFGNNEYPDIKAFEAFLESRCFPRERDKMKLALRELDLPFYDPMLIVEKTQGRMAEDDFWIRIEREI